MSAAEILGELERRGVSVAVEGETLCLKPKRALDDGLLARVRESKAEILRELTQQLSDGCPPLPRGVRLIRWDPRPAPVAIDMCSVIVDVPKFIKSELLALDSRLNNPWTIRGGFTVPQTLDRLAQAGLEVELEPKGGASTTKFQNTEGGNEIK